MTDHIFSGFGGVPIAASSFGAADDPPVLMLPGAGQKRQGWTDVARALAAAGRYVVSIDLRGQGGSGVSGDGPSDIDAHIRDLRTILAEFSSRPVIIGADLGGWIAALALGEGEPDLATGLVLIDPLRPDPAAMDAAAGLIEQERRIADAAARLKLPVMIIAGEPRAATAPTLPERLTKALLHAEPARIDGALAMPERADALSAALIEFLERRVPRKPPEYHQGSDSRTLRDALGCFGTGVTVVTTIDGNGNPVGLTANSFTAVSLEPELLLVCLANSAASLPAFQTAERFAVNVLHIGQQPVSNRFASRGADKFAGTDIEIWEGGVPIIRDSLASFECDKHAMHGAGDHEILIGRVRRVRYEPQRDPLLYFRGKYRRLHFA